MCLLVNTQFIYSILFYWLGCAACRIFVSWPGIKPGPQKWKCQGISPHSTQFRSQNCGRIFTFMLAFLVAQTVKNLPAVQETRVQSLGWEDPLEKGMATHSHIFAWKILWIEEPGRLQSMGSWRVGHNLATNTCFYAKVFLFLLFFNIPFFKGLFALLYNKKSRCRWAWGSLSWRFSGLFHSLRTGASLLSFSLRIVENYLPQTAWTLGSRCHGWASTVLTKHWGSGDTWWRESE